MPKKTKVQVQLFCSIIAIILIAVFANISGQVVPTNQLTSLWLRASAYINWGQTRGTSGYGIRDNAGAIEAKNSGGSWVAIAPSGGAAPDDATYITQTANATLSNEQAIGALSSGILRGATTTGVITSLSDTLPFANGGFGFSTATLGDIFYASGTNTPGKLADVATGQVIISGGVGAAPSFSANPTVTTVKLGATATIGATSNKLTQVTDTGNTTGLEINGGTPTLGTCTGGSVVSGSHNTAGEVTGNTSGSCVVNFGTPNFTNTPFCFINDESALIAVRISARSASSITVTGAGSGDAFQFFCIGRIGT